MKRLLVGFVFAAVLAAPACAQGSDAFNTADRDAALEEIAQVIDDEYFDEVRAGELAAQLRQAHADGAFGEADSPHEFAMALTEYLRSQDRHFSVRYVGTDLPEDRAHEGAEGGSADPMQRANYGFREVTILPGNIGYIRFDMFADASNPGAAQAALAALRFVANTDAVVFDVRENGGGAPSMVQLLISHFLNPEDEVVINTFISRDTAYPSELRALSYLPAGSRPDVPLYVLISGNTGSAAEAFAYHLQAMERATVVGATSYGAGNPGDHFYLSSGFSVFVSTGSARNPITQSNWEGVGVAPDVAVDADQALDQALLLAYGELTERADDEMLQASWSWALELVEARLTPQVISNVEMVALAGTYGPRRIFVDDGTLMYQRDDQTPLPLVKLGPDRFMLQGIDEIRVTFQRDGSGNIVSLTLTSIEQQSALSPKD